MRSVQDRAACLGILACAALTTPGSVERVLGQEESVAASPRKVAIVIHDGVELLDFAGPAEVFKAAQFHVYTVAETADPIISQNFLKVTPNCTINDCPGPDILVIPGGATGNLLSSPPMMEWIKNTCERSDVTLTVCTGAFALAKNGLLDGKRATTHWSAIEGLRRAAPTATVEENVRFIDNGKIITTAGVSAGIDGALHLVMRILGRRRAWETARYMEYHWEPPAEAHPDDRQRASRDALRHLVFRRWHEAAEAYRKLLADNPQDADAIFGLGASLNGAGRYEEAIEPLKRAIEQGKRDAEGYAQLGRAEIHAKRAQAAAQSMAQAVKLGDTEPINRYNLACAYALTGRAADALATLKQAFSLGMGNVGAVLTDSDLASLHTEPGFRELIRDHQRSPATRLVTEEEPGDPLIVSGIIRDSAGAPVPQAVVYVFHADLKGEYTPTSPMDEAHARIFGYMRTCLRGRYEFRTVRPGGYQNPIMLDGMQRLIPQHIHFEVTAPGFVPRSFQMVFDDDPRMDDHWRNHWAASNDFPVVKVSHKADGQRVECDITLAAQ